MSRGVLFYYSFQLSCDKKIRFVDALICIIFAAIKLKKTNEKDNAMNNSNYANRSVSSIVNENYAAARVFKYFGIDFCCGGGALLDFAFFIELFEFFGERSGIERVLGAEEIKGQLSGIEAASGIEAWADLEANGFGVDRFDAGAAHEFLEAGAASFF